MTKEFTKLVKKNENDKKAYYKRLAGTITPEGLGFIKALDEMRERHLKAFIGYPNVLVRNAHTCFFDFAVSFLNGAIKKHFSKENKSFPKVVIHDKPHPSVEKDMAEQKESLTDFGYNTLKDIWYKDTPIFFALLSSLLSDKDVFVSNFMVSNYNMFLDMLSFHIKQTEQKEKRA